MTKTELIESMIDLSMQNCTQVAELQYYDGEGPFLFAVDEKDGTPKFFCFSFADSDEFLERPDDLPVALQSPNFPFALAECLDLDYLEGSGQHYQLTYNKIAPDTPDCRAALKALRRTDPQTASLISLLSEEGELTPAMALESELLS